VIDTQAFNHTGALYLQGEHGLVQYKSKALEYFIRGSELGSGSASYEVANAYHFGHGVAKNE
jgi:TPR repeat protein